MSFSSLAGTLPSPFDLRLGRREKVLAFENAQIDAQGMGHRFHHVHPISKEVKLPLRNNEVRRRKKKERKKSPESRRKQQRTMTRTEEMYVDASHSPIGAQRNI